MPSTHAPLLWHARHAYRVTVLLTMGIGLLALLAGCGGSSNGTAEIPAPHPTDPAHGSAAQVLIADSGLEQWVGVDSTEAADTLRANRESGTEEWLLGEVVPEPAHHLGFYFAPASVSVAEVTAEGIQTSLDQISMDPAYYVPGGPGVFPQWAVFAKVLDIVD
jgi:hypothetical protein